MIRREARPTLLAFLLLAAPLISSPRLNAQSPPPDAYSITEINSTTVKGMKIETYRNGTKALIDKSYPPNEARPKGFHTRTLFDFELRRQFTWDLVDESIPCTATSFLGDWGDDPFRTSAQMTAEIANQYPQEAGREKVNGIQAKIVKVVSPGQGASTLWVEDKYGLVVRLEVAPENGPGRVLSEVTEMKIAAPRDSLLELPESCRAVAKSVRSHGPIEMVGLPPGYNPATCKMGFVWREAFEGDTVCVTGLVHSQSANDNRLAPQRTRPDGRCKQGYVWRDAGPNDHVCVLPATRSQAAADNAQAGNRVATREEQIDP